MSTSFTTNTIPMRVNGANTTTGLLPELNQESWLNNHVSITVSNIQKTLSPHLQALGLSDQVKIRLFNAGAYNVLYKLSSKDPLFPPLLVRIACKEIACNRLDSEVATMEFVRAHTTIPVPKVYAYDSSHQNPIGASWILLERFEAETYASVERSLSSSQREAIGKKIADWIHQLRGLSFDKIGCLYSYNNHFVVGQFISNTDIPEPAWVTDPQAFSGPYADMEEYYRSFWESELRLCIQNPSERGEEGVKAISALLHNLAPFDQTVGSTKSRARLQHVDISASNILIDKPSGLAVAMIDWDRARTMPIGVGLAEIPIIVEPSGYPSKDRSRSIQKGFYSRIEELEPGFLSSFTTEKAVKHRLLHRIQ